MKYKGVIFDLDGTLLNSLEDLCESVNYALNKMGYNRRSIDEVRSFVGNGVDMLIKRALPNDSDDRVQRECLSIFKEYYEIHKKDKTAPYEGITELLYELKSNGISMAIVSNKYDLAVKELNKEIFGNLISTAIGTNEKIKKKPHTDGIMMALKELGLTESEVIYVGDSDVDMMTAHNAGVDVIGVTWGFRDRELLEKMKANYITDNPIEIVKIIKG